MSHIQKGHTPSGCTRVGMTCRAYYEAGGAIGKEDVVNGFPSTDRQAIADSWNRRFPEAGMLYKAAYGRESVVVVPWTDEDGILHLNITTCEDGSRQGDCLGSGVFCAVAQDVYEEVAKVCPPSFSLEAIIDDLHILIEPQPDDEAWHVAYEQYATLRAFYAEEWAKRGGKLGKSQLLLPPGAPWPREGVLPPEIDVTWEGMTCVGSDIGQLTFRRARFKLLLEKFSAQLACIRKLRELGQEQHLLSLSITTSGMNTKFHFYSRANPLVEMEDLIDEHDWLIREHNKGDLSLEGLFDPGCSAERWDRANALLDQPRSRSGTSIGRTPLIVIAYAAWCAGVLDAAASANFCKVRHALAKYCAPSHARILELLGTPDTTTWTEELSLRLPSDPEMLTSGPFANTLLLSFKKPGVQGAIVRNIMAGRLHSLDKSNSVASQRMDKTNLNLTEHDAVGWHVLRFRSWASRAINQPGKAATYFLGRHFVPYMRFMLMIPQLVRGADYAEGGRHNGDFQPCLMCRKGERLDPWATHAALCTGTSDANQALHDDMVMTLYLWIRATIPWHRVKHEPSAPYLLRNSYTRDECALLFHGNGTVETRKKAAELRQVVDKRNASVDEARVALDRESCVLSAALTNSLIQRKAVSSSSSKRDKSKTSQTAGVHPDLAVMINSCPNMELWGDYCGAHDHSTNDSQTKSTLNKIARAEAQAQKLDNHGPGRNSLPRRVEPTTVVQARTTMKTNKFQPLLDAAVDAHKRGARTCKPLVLPLIFTALGTIGAGGLRLIHHVVTTAAGDLGAGGVRRDGKDATRKVRELRDDLLYKLMLCHAKGVGSMLATAAGIVRFR